MLDYKVNAKKIITDTQRLKPLFCTIEDYGFDDKLVVSVVHDGTKTFNVGENITIEHVKKVDTSTHYNGLSAKYYTKHVISSVDGNANKFSFEIEKYYQNELIEFKMENSNNNPGFILIFANNHYFNYNDICNVWIKYLDDNVLLKSEITCNFVDEYTLLWKVDMDKETDINFANYLINGGSYSQIGANLSTVDYVEMSELPDKVNYSSPNYILIRGGEEDDFIDTIYLKSVSYRELNGEKFNKDNCFFDKDDNLTILIDSISFQVSIPIEQKFDVSTNREMLIAEKLTTYAAGYTISKVSSLEKDVYYPVLIEAHQNDELPHFAKRIIFNLHFRKRNLANGWETPNDDTFWNGTNDFYPTTPYLSNSAFWNQGQGVLSNFIDNRSDLLSKIGFTDDDVKYQKSRLKKSFLRLSIYDSTNQAKQTLLGYSTIFINSGNLLSKYIKYSNTGFHFTPKGDNDVIYQVQEEKKPISVFNEPYTEPYNSDDFEAMRLSTQFVVSDRFFSNSSSEGFYIHLYKDFSSEIPKDLFMKIDFSHAGYGKIIPFFMPSFIKTSDSYSAIKTYNDILTDWDIAATQYGYGFEKFNKYSYIHLKYRYDYNLKKHVYYLDHDYYGSNVMYDNKNDIIINLYEAKVNI